MKQIQIKFGYNEREPTMIISLLPSEIARLILNYLEEESLLKTYQTFLNECKHLEECKLYLNRGIQVPKTIHGKNLIDYLVIDLKSEPHLNDVCISGNKEASTQTDTFLDQAVKRPFALIDQTNINHSNDNIFVSPQKKRLLIGKNAEKKSELSVSTLERQLDSIINDAFEHLKQEEEQEQQNHLLFTTQASASTPHPTVANSDGIVLIAPNHTDEHEHEKMFFNMIPLSDQVVDNHENHQVVQPRAGGHLNLKQALKQASKPVELIAHNVASSTTRNSSIRTQLSTSLNEKKNPTNNVVVQKKRVYKRVTPTIRKIYEKETQMDVLTDMSASLPVPVQAISTNQHENGLASGSEQLKENNSSDSNFFEIPFAKVNTSKTEDDELDLIFGTSSQSKLNSKPPMENSAMDEEFELIFGSDIFRNTRSSLSTSNNNNNCVGFSNMAASNKMISVKKNLIGGAGGPANSFDQQSTARTLRSRTSSLRRMI